MNDALSRRGFITLAAVLLLLAVSIAVALEVLMISWQSVDLGTAADHGSQARSLADACSELSASRFWSDRLYRGSESVQFEEGRCSVMPIASGSFQVKTEGVASDVIARDLTTFEVSADASGSVQSVRRTLFQRVADF